MNYRIGGTAQLAILLCLAAAPAAADSFFFSTGNPDGLLGALSRTPAGGETETADDFVLNAVTTINQATFTGLLPSGTPLSSVQDVEIEFYHVFPGDSGPFDNRVPTRVNSPGDVQFLAFDAFAGTLAFNTTLMNVNFSVANTVINGINPLPSVFTGGEGPASGEEVQFNVSFTPPFDLPAGQYFFRPEVQLASGNFLWLSAPRPIVPPGTPFANDLQAWIRNTNLDPDWERIGTDITHTGPFNMTFTLSGTAAPEPGTLAFSGIAAGLLLLAPLHRRLTRRK